MEHAAELEHRGPQIEKAYYPEYFDEAPTTFPLYSWELILGSSVMLAGMGTLGLPITAAAYMNENGDVSMGLVIAAAVFFVIVETIGLLLVVTGFKRHTRDDDQHVRDNHHVDSH